MGYTRRDDGKSAQSIEKKGVGSSLSSKRVRNHEKGKRLDEDHKVWTVWDGVILRKLEGLPGGGPWSAGREVMPK